MALYDLYEKDGAVFRTPAGPCIRPIADVKQADGTWAPYKGDRMAPVTFGDHLGQQEFGPGPAE